LNPRQNKEKKLALDLCSASTFCPNQKRKKGKGVEGKLPKLKDDMV
jgi:hypothetical protein